MINTIQNDLHVRTDMPKLHSPFVREENDQGHYVVVDEVAEGYEWVFEDGEDVIAVEKLDGTNVSIVLQNGVVAEVFNRSNRIPFINKDKPYIIEGIQNAWARGYIDQLPANGQFFGELVGPDTGRNSYGLEEHLWIPFRSYAQRKLFYESWGKYPTTFDAISTWFQEGPLPLFFQLWHGCGFDEAVGKNGYAEGIIFTHADGRMAKLRRDMFPWYHEEGP